MLLQPTGRGQGLTGSQWPSLGIKNGDPDSLITGRDEGTTEGGRRSALRVNWVLETVSAASTAMNKKRKICGWWRKMKFDPYSLLIYSFAADQNSHSSSLAAQCVIGYRLSMLTLVSIATVQHPSDALKLTCARAKQSCFSLKNSFCFHCLS